MHCSDMGVQAKWKENQKFMWHLKIHFEKELSMPARGEIYPPDNTSNCDL